MLRILLLSILLSIGANPAFADKWSGEDKGLHLIGGGVLSATATIHWQSRMAGFAAGCGTGVAFELLAPAMNGVRSSKDAVVTCLGAALGSMAGGWHLQANGILFKKEF